MQPPFQQSAASAHVDDMMRAAQSYRLAGVDRPRRRRRLVSFGAVRSALIPSVHKPRHA
jgi:hypothetical protein